MTNPILPGRRTVDAVRPGQQDGHTNPRLDDASLTSRRQSLHFAVVTLLETDMRARRTMIDQVVRTLSTSIKRSGAG